MPKEPKPADEMLPGLFTPPGNRPPGGAAPDLQPGHRVAFYWKDTPITCDERRHINLTEMFRADGSPANKDPKFYAISAGGREFIEDLASNLKVRKSNLWNAKRGKNLSGTWAHWQVALAYAKYLSTAFHRFANEAFREWAEEQADPELKLDRSIQGFRRKGRDDEWIARRLEGKAQRVRLTSLMSERAVEGRGFADATNAINVKVLGGTAREIKLARGLAPKAKTRDHLDYHELAALRFAESLAEKGIHDHAAFGNTECVDECRRAGSVVRRAIDTFIGAPRDASRRPNIEHKDTRPYDI